MMLCIDVGNSHIYGGVFSEETLRLRFRQTSKISTSDELGIFLKAVLRENNCSPDSITQIAICSVVPQIDYSLRSACMKYFSIEPFFLHAEVKTGLQVHYRNPLEIGADRIANAIAAVHAFPERDMIVIDFGTAITLCVIGKEKSYHGGAILPGLRLSMEALSKNTAKLAAVEIVKPDQVLGRSTGESIQAGIYFGALGACKELLLQLKNTFFAGVTPLVLATGGFAALYENQGIYDHCFPDLVLQGVRLAALMNDPID